MDLKSISLLIEKYRQNKCTPEEKEALYYWFSAIGYEPEKEPDGLTDPSVKERIWENIRHRKAGHVEAAPVLTAARWWQTGWARAASVGILLAIAGSIYLSDRLQPAKELPAFSLSDGTGWRSFQNDTPGANMLQLEDGSRVTLESGAQLSYPASFNDEQRTVRLEGNATFDVASDPDRPFFVYSKGIRTKVLGTSFTITGSNHGSIEVAVHSGKVLVERASGKSDPAPGKQEEVILTPNKKVVFYEREETFVTGLVDQPRLLPGPTDIYAQKDAFVFDETRLEEVLKKIEKAYGVAIKVENPLASECPVTANLSEDNLYSKLEVIGAILNLETEVRGDRIYLKGSGCAGIP